MKFYQVINDDNLTDGDNVVSNGNIYRTEAQALQEILTNGFMLVPKILKSASMKHKYYKFYKPYDFLLADYVEYADIVELTLVEHDSIMDGLSIDNIENNVNLIEEFLNSNPSLEVSEVDL